MRKQSLSLLLLVFMPLSLSLQTVSRAAGTIEYSADMEEMSELVIDFPFDSPDTAAKHFAQNYFPVTDYIQLELATIIYSYRLEKGELVFSYLKPVAGTVSSVQPLLLEELLPEGADMVAVAHTHSMGNISFSGSDKAFAYTIDVAVYLIGTRDLLKVYEKETVITDKAEEEAIVWRERIVTNTLEFRELSELELSALYYALKPKWEALAASSHASDRILYQWTPWPNTQNEVEVVDFIPDEAWMTFFKEYLFERLLIDPTS